MSIYVAGLISYLLGMSVYLVTGIGFSLILSLSLLIFTAVGVSVKRYKPVRLLQVILFFLGVVLLSASTDPTPTELDGYIDRYTQIEGIVVEIPDEHDEYYSYIVKADELSYLGESIKIDRKLRITSPIRLDTGNRAAFRGFLDIISAPANSTEFDYRPHYRAKDITHKMHSEEVEVLKERDFYLSFPYIAEYVKSRIGMSVDRFYSNDDASMIKAVLLGNRSEFSDEFESVLIKTSALRFLYPSYLHIFLLLSVCQAVFAIAIPRYRQQATVIAIFLFVLFNAGLITFVRAGVLLLADRLLKKMRGFSHYPDMISAVIVSMLIAEPLLIYSAGFVISIAVGILLHFFRAPLSNRILPTKKRKVRNLISMWIIGTAGLMPFSAYFFNGMPIYSIIFTLVYTPLTLILLITTPISLLLNEIFGSASFIGVAVDTIVTLMKNLPQMVALLPGHYITLAKPSIIFVLIFILACYMLKLRLDECTKTVQFKASAATIIILAGIWATSAISEFGKLEVTFPNVGQGDASIINIKGKTTVLLDGGGGTGEDGYNIGEKVYLPYLIAKGYNKIDLAIASHSHRDHAEGIIAAIEALDVDTVMLSDTQENNSYKDEIIAAAEANGTEVLYVSAGDRIEFNSGLTIDVIYPERAVSVSDENDYSLGLIVKYKDTSMFFGGDITNRTEKKIEGRIGKVDALKVSHHGSNGSSRTEFIEETSPNYAVVSVGRNNMYGHPADRVVCEYTDSGAKILRTDLMNDIVLKSNGSGRIAASWYGEGLEWR